jgi:hypothetical protein
MRWICQLRSAVNGCFFVCADAGAAALRTAINDAANVSHVFVLDECI